MPITERIAYIGICDKCGQNVQKEWTHFNKQDLIDVELTGYDRVADYNENTGEIICFRCSRKYPELRQKDEDETLRYKRSSEP